MKKIITLFVFGISMLSYSQTTLPTEEETTTTGTTTETQATTQSTVQQTEASEKEEKKSKHKKSSTPFIKRFYFGGTFGATFGNYTSITVAPTIGYAIKPSLYTGIKVYYTYSEQKIRINKQEEKFSYNNYGFGTFLRWFLIKGLYLHVAPEAFNYQYNTVDQSNNVVENREWVPYLWAGAGLRKRTSKRSWISVHVLFDLIQDSNSPYEEWEPNLVIGAGTSF